VDRLAKIALRSGLYSVGAVPEVDLVQVQLEDLVLRISLLNLTGDLRLLDLANEVLFAGDALGEDVSRELHRYGGEALLPRARAEVAQRGAGDTNPVDAGVLVETLVLGEDERVLHDFRDLGDLHERAALEPDLSDEAPVGGVDLRGLPRRVGIQDLDWRTASTVADEDPAREGDAAAERDEEREPEQNRADQFGIPLGELAEARRRFHPAGEATTGTGNREQSRL